MLFAWFRMSCSFVLVIDDQDIIHISFMIYVVFFCCLTTVLRIILPRT